MRKVAERVCPRIGPKVDERDSLLEQIRTKVGCSRCFIVLFDIFLYETVFSFPP